VCSEIDTPIKPKTFYGSCKAGLHSILTGLAKDQNVSFSWGRLFFPYGPHENAKRLIPSTILSLLRGQNATCNHRDVARDFIFVEDAAEVFAALADGDFTGPINIGSGSPVTLGAVVDLIGKSLQCESLIERTAAPHLPTSEPPVLLADVSRLKETLNLLPQTDLQDGIERTISSWRNYLTESQALP
jgi:nucleoside-diphosphate-sugar epimerase